MKYLGICLGAALMCNAASADMQLTMKEEHKGAMEDSGETKISVRDGKVVFSGGDDAGFSMIYDSATGTISQVDHGQKMYIEMDKKAMKETANQMSEMMKQVEAQLANLPKEQREMMMKSMPGVAQGMNRDKAPKAVDIEWTGKEREVAGYPCKVAKVTEEGKASGEACIAKPKDLGMSKEDFEALASMFETMKEFADATTGENSMPDMRAIGGFPIAMSDPEEGVRSELVSASDAALDGKMFEIPASYKKQSMPQF